MCRENDTGVKPRHPIRPERPGGGLAAAQSSLLDPEHRLAHLTPSSAPAAAAPKSGRFSCASVDSPPSGTSPSPGSPLRGVPRPPRHGPGMVLQPSAGPARGGLLRVLGGRSGTGHGLGGRRLRGGRRHPARRLRRGAAAPVLPLGAADQVNRNTSLSLECTFYGTLMFSFCRMYVV